MAKLTIENPKFGSTPIAYDVEISRALLSVPARIDVKKSILDFGSHRGGLGGGGESEGNEVECCSK